MPRASWKGFLRLSLVSCPVYLLPATRHTANPGAVTSFFRGIEGGWRRLHFPQPVGNRSGITVKSVDAITLPRVFPSLQATEFVVDSGMGLTILMRSAMLRRLMEKYQSQMLKVAKSLGPKRGIIGYDIGSAVRRRQRVFVGENSYMIAVIPAIEAAIAIANGRFSHRGLVAPIHHLPLDTFLAAVEKERIQMITV